MGNADSTNFRTIYQSWTQPELVPKVTDKPKFDVDYGFSEANPVREIKATEEEMYLAKIPANRRDYCGHHLIDLMKCKRDNFPFLSKCEHYTHEWNNCQNEDGFARMKMFERERRLLAREHRKKAAAEKEELAAE